MHSTLSLILAVLSQFFMPRYNAQLRLLKAQIDILRAPIRAAIRCCERRRHVHDDDRTQN